jgi:hypothetical protein
MKPLVLIAFLLSLLLAQQPTQPLLPLDYVCPMDHDVRAAGPGKCTRCGMKLVVGIPDLDEYPVDLHVSPPLIRPGEKAALDFRILDPKTSKPVERFQIVHEKLFHLFIVSQDLSFFVHDHPVLQPNHDFKFETSFPQAGMYRVLCDFYPEGGAPQLVAKTIIVPGTPSTAAPLRPDLGAKHASNLDVELSTEPAVPIAGMKTLMFFKVKPAEGLEPYLGAWGHMLAASDDLVDLIHNHPFLADGGPQIQFNMIFPRARTYRVWVQFQRKGVVNTAAFNVPVSRLQ